MSRIPNLIIQHLFWKGCYYLSVLMVNVLISRMLGAGGSGHVFFMINNLSLLILLLSGSLESGAGFFSAHGAMDSRRIARFSLSWAIVATLLFLVLTYFFQSLTALAGLLPMEAAIFFIPGILLTSFFSALFYARKNFVAPNLILLLVNLAWIAVLLVCGQQPFLRGHFIVFYFSVFFVQGILITVFYFLTTARIQPAATFSSAQRKLLLQYSGHALFANLLFFLVTRIDYWFVEKYCSAADLGNYIQASKLLQLLLVIPSTIAATLFPLIAASAVDLHLQLKRITRVIISSTFVAALAIAIPGRWLFPAVFGNSFHGMYPLFLLLIPGLLALAAHYPITAYFSGNNRIRVNIGGAFLAVLVITGLDLLLLPRLGVLLAAVVCSVGYCCYLAYLIVTLEKDKRGSARDFFLFARGDWHWFRQWFIKRGGL